MSFGGSLAKDVQGHCKYIETVELLQRRHISLGLPTSLHHVFFLLKNTMLIGNSELYVVQGVKGIE